MNGDALLAQDPQLTTSPRIPRPQSGSSGDHQLTHSSGQDAEIKKMDRFITRLASIPEGRGSLLDHCLITFGSAMGDDRKHDHRDLPCVVAGHASGALKGGRYLRLKGETPMANLFVTTAQFARTKLDRFGDSTGALTLGRTAEEGRVAEMV